MLWALFVDYGVKPDDIASGCEGVSQRSRHWKSFACLFENFCMRSCR